FPTRRSSDLVAARVDRVAEELFGTHVFRRPDDEACARERFSGPLFDRFRDTEVDDLRDVTAALAWSDDDVVRLQVAMDDSQLVRGDECLRDLVRDVDRP